MTQLKLSSTQKLVFSAISMALYISVLFLSQQISFGAYQMRLATSLYSLTYLFPFLALPLSLANGLANIFGGLGVLDVVGGVLVGLLTTGGVYLVRHFKLNSWFVILPIFLIPAFVAPLWLSILLKVPYLALVLNLLIGQFIPGLIGAILVKELAKRGFKI